MKKIIKIRKKLIAIVTAMILTVLTASSFVTSADVTSNDNNSLEYVIYNAKTNEKLEEDYCYYTLDSMPSTDNSRLSGVKGDDDRYKDWSKSGVVKIMSENRNSYIGTGFVVGEHVIATAAHCLKGAKIPEILLFNSDGIVTMHATPVEKHYLKAFDTDAFGSENDYGLITVKEDLSDYMCFDLAVPLDSAKGNSVKITGFPEKIEKNGNEITVNDGKKHMKYTGSGTIQDIFGGYMSYDADMTHGNSGGPVYMTETFNGRQYFSVVAICSTVAHWNDGSKMTFDKIHFFNNNDNIRY